MNTVFRGVKTGHGGAQGHPIRLFEQIGAIQAGQFDPIGIGLTFDAVKILEIVEGIGKPTSLIGAHAGESLTGDGDLPHFLTRRGILRPADWTGQSQILAGLVPGQHHVEFVQPTIHTTLLRHTTSNRSEVIFYVRAQSTTLTFDRLPPMDPLNNLFTAQGDGDAYDDDADFREKFLHGMERLRFMNIHESPYCPS